MPDAQPLFLLHPAAMLSGVWAPLRHAWGQHWRILALDLVPAGEPATQFARWAAQAADQITIAGGAAHVVGASLGASVTLRLALDHPALVASLILDSLPGALSQWLVSSSCSGWDAISISSDVRVRAGCAQPPARLM